MSDRKVGITFVSVSNAVQACENGNEINDYLFREAFGPRIQQGIQLNVICVVGRLSQQMLSRFFCDLTRVQYS